ncbi:MAG: NAD-dependent epimerase/dehydratase family protein [Pseudomonadota bacterium]
MKVLVTGAAGFIGADLVAKLLAAKHEVTGVDNFNDYYDVSLKHDRVSKVIGADFKEFELIDLDICDRDAMRTLFADRNFDVVVNLAAQAGVRYSLENPSAYIDTNLVGFGNILEGCRVSGVSHLVFASSSSVYGENKDFPFAEKDRVDHPVSLYAATKKANELMAHSYAHLYGIHCTGLRFFTVYGPWGRPDMAPFRFASRMLAGEEIPVYNQGNMIRDFTYIDDINEGVMKVIHKVDDGEKYRIYNIGRGEPVQLMDFIEALSEGLKVEAKINYLPMQAGDVPRTMADTTALKKDFAYSPQVSVKQGVRLFADWYLDYYGS